MTTTEPAPSSPPVPVNEIAPSSEARAFGSWGIVARAFVACLAAAIVWLVFSVATHSPFNAHPDEPSHTGVAEYYVNNWLPPRLDDPAVMKTRSMYGFTYFDEWDVTYFFMGRWVALVGPLIGEDYFAYRSFQLALLTLLVGAIVFTGRHPAHLLLLLTPQVWYVFSYANGDAFPLTVSCFVLLMREFASPASLERGRARPGRAALFGALIGLLTISKRNYLAFVLPMGGWIFLELCLVERERARTWLRFVLPYLACGWFLVVAARLGPDYAVNGTGRAKLADELREQTAAPGFKLSTPPKKRYGNYRLRDRGVRFVGLFRRYNWHYGNFLSFVGLYGWLDKVSSEIYYRVQMHLLPLLLAVLVALAVAERRYLALLVGAGGVLLTFAGALYHCWTFDFQAQGRYLFPMLPALAFVGLALRSRRSRAVLGITLFSTIAFGLVSFVPYASSFTAPVPG